LTSQSKNTHRTKKAIILIVRTQIEVRICFVVLYENYTNLYVFIDQRVIKQPYQNCFKLKLFQAIETPPLPIISGHFFQSPNSSAAAYSGQQATSGSP